MEENFGTLEGEICNRFGCEGIIQENSSGESCYCHINPPCSSCCNVDQFCEECGWSNLEEHNNYLQEIQKRTREQEKNEAYKIQRVYDERKIYSIYKYFDDHFEGIVAENLTEKEAEEKKQELSVNTYYVSYQIRKNE